MSKEIQQPNIQRLNLEDPFSWAVMPRVHIEWVRQVGPQLDIDVEKYVRGSVLADIIGDDANCFTWRDEGSSFDPDIAKEQKRYLIERMDAEITTPETPSIIKEWLELTRQKVLVLDWGCEDEFEHAKVEWYRFKTIVKGLIQKDPDLKEAEEYYKFIQKNRLSPYWREFYTGK